MAKKLSLSEFISKANKKHNSLYGYERAVFVNTATKIIITCPIHGDFEQTPNNHLNGNKCPKCRTKHQNNDKKDTTQTFIEKAQVKHIGKYGYSKVEYVNSKTKIIITCPIHGDFEQTPVTHLKGSSCPKCGNLSSSNSKMFGKDVFVVRANKIHNNKFDYSKTDFSVNTKLSEIGTFICPTHGEFEQEFMSHLKGFGCQKCATDSLKMSQEEFVDKCSKIHKENNYDYSKTIFRGSYEKIIVGCPIHGEFEQVAYVHISGSRCQKCAGSVSKCETEIYEFVRKVLGNDVGVVVRGDRNIIKPLEIDIFIPSKQIGIEYNGLYWHSEANREADYHQKKTELAESKNIQLIQIFQDEWETKREIVESRLKTILGKTETHIYARNTKIRKLDLVEAKEFFNSNHIQGFVGGVCHYGLVDKFNQIVSAMSFGKQRKNMGGKDEIGCYELLRFSNSINKSVVGGASKLLKCFVEKYKPRKIISYCDRRWSIGGLYNQMGFELVAKTKPNYFYIVNGQRKNRFGFRKDILISQYGCPPEKTEHQFCLEQGFLRIYDSGHYKFEKYYIQ